jgi:hypothetical protein
VGTGTTNGNATLLQGRAMADTEPTNGQAVVWDSMLSTWKPGGGSDIGGRAWDAAATYTQGDLVATSQREAWICIQNDNTNHDPTEAESTWWAPLPADAVSLQLRPVATTAPTGGQVLAWSDTNNQWEPSIPPPVLGINAVASNSTSVAIGNNAAVDSGDARAIAIGTDSFSQSFGISIGSSASNNGQNGIAIGRGAFAGSVDSIAIGTNAQAYSASQVIIGAYDIGQMSTTLSPLTGKINEIITWINNNGGSITPL